MEPNQIKIDKLEEPQRRIVEAVVGSDTPKYYANGFTMFVGNADTGLILQQNGVPIAVVNMSYTLAKTMAQKLGGLIHELEQATKRDFLTTDQIDEARG